MEMKKTFTLIALAILLGFGTEALKKFKVIGGHASIETEAVNTAGMDLSPYHRANENDLTPSRGRKGLRLAHVVEASGKHDFGKAPAKKKADDKKKKAKKKDKKQKAVAGSHSGLRGKGLAGVYEESKTNRKSEDSNTPHATQGAPAPAVPVTKSNDDYAKWAALLLSSPNRNNVIEFIRAFQAGDVEVETYYKLIQAMYDKGTEDFQSYAVLAAGATPSLRSFQFLATAHADQVSGSPVSSQIVQELGDYELLQYLWITSNVLQNTQDLHMAGIAARAFANSANRYLGAAPTVPSGTPPQDDRTPSSVSRANSLQFFAHYTSSLRAAAERFQGQQEILDYINAALKLINTPNQLVAQSPVP